MISLISLLASFPKCSTSATLVAFIVFCSASAIFIIFSILLCEKLFCGITSKTFIVPSVIVPVLSRQSTFARASISIEYMFLTRVFFLASFTTPTVKPTVIRRYIPAGIIPVSAPLVLVMASSMVAPVM